MKKCQRCGMTTKEDTECPFCKTTLTYEPETKIDSEKKMNKYFFLYLLKKCCFSLICFIVVLIRFLIKLPKFDVYFAIITFLTILSMAVSIEQAFRKKEVYWRALTVIILSGIIAMLFSFIMW